MATQQKRRFKTVSRHRHVPLLSRRRTWFDDTDGDTGPVSEPPATDSTTDSGNVQNPIPQGPAPDTTAKPSSDTGSDGGTFPAEVVKDLRKENASWRTKLRETESRVERLEQQLRDEKVAQMKLATIQDLGLPADAMEFLTGTDAETIKVQAEKFKSLIPDIPDEQAARSPNTPRTATTALPGGEPLNETYDQKMARIYGRSGRT